MVREVTALQTGQLRWKSEGTSCLKETDRDKYMIGSNFLRYMQYLKSDRYIKSRRQNNKILFGIWHHFLVQISNSTAHWVSAGYAFVLFEHGGCLLQVGTHVCIQEYTWVPRNSHVPSRAGGSQPTRSNPIHQAACKYSSDAEGFAAWKNWVTFTSPLGKFTFPKCSWKSQQRCQGLC